MRGLFKQNQTLAELEEQDEKLDVELSVAQKRAAIAQLKQRGLSPQHFGDTAKPSTWQRIIDWIKTH